ncbi:MAG: PAS domain-containing sensor histidine kinase [Opitutaceae bacterium]
MSQRLEWGGSLAGSFILTADCRILEVNGAALRWLGYSEDELVGKPFHVVLGSGGQFFLQSQILPMLKLKGSLEEIYLRMRGKSGDTGPMLANTALRETGEPRIEFTFLRIPQRGHLEDELLQARKMAEQASDAKTKFLGMMSHELRTPLQLIGLNNQMLLGGECGLLNEEQKEMLEASQSAADSVAVLIDDILDFVRMQGGPANLTLEPVRVSRVLDRAEISLRHRLHQAGLICARRPGVENLSVLADKNRLQQILLNLLNNALKFTPRNGSVTIASHRADEFVVIEVIDTGCGIPPEQLQRIFEPFVQLTTSIESTDKPGIGLGLAICRDLARAMGGRMGVKSELGVGSTFSISLPCATPREQTGSAET